MMRVSQGNKTIHPLISLAVFACLAMGAPSHALAGEEPVLPKLTAENGRVIAQEMQPALQRFVDQQRRLPGQARHVAVKVIPDPAKRRIYIDLDAGFLPKDMPIMTEDFGQLLREIENEAYELLSGVVDFEIMKTRIGGKEIQEIYPPGYLLDQKGRAGTQAVMPPVAGLVVINPGHGKYYHHGLTSWQYQRPEPYIGTTNVFEDTVTPGYATTLASLLVARNVGFVTSVKHTRDLGNTAIDPESNLPWAALGARYYLKRLYPALGMTIWNRYPNGTSTERLNLREYDEDVRARPEYANYINAETFISLHTNAATPTARGASFYTNDMDPQSLALTQNVQCYLKEQIQQLPQYATYVIRPGILPGLSYAEVREANMPTVLVELGFHTNMLDAAALQNSAFRTAAMRGIEKGYRTFKAGETECDPFKIASIPVAASGGYYVYFPVPISYTGKPRFPVVVKTVNVSCPKNWTCSNKTNSFSSATGNQLIPKFYCTAQATTAPGTLVWKTTVTDADGIVTAAVEHTTRCEPA